MLPQAVESPYAIDLDRRRSVQEILGGALDLYRHYPWLFLVLALSVIAPYDLAVLALTGSSPLGGGTHESVGTSFLLLLLNLALVSPLVSALHVHAVVLVGEGGRPRLGEVAVRGLRVLGVVVAADIMSALGITLGYLALVVPGVLLSLRWSVVAQAAAIENEGWLPALRRSGLLTAGHYWRIFGLILVTGLLTFAAIRGAAAIPSGSSSSIGSIALGIAVHTLTASFAALTLALLYFDLRARTTEAHSQRSPEYQHLRDLD